MDHYLAAIDYARSGYRVLPVWGCDQEGRCRCPLGANCQTPGKHPQHILVPRGLNDATIDETTIHRWWEADPDAGIGISLAASGLLALDIDPRNGGWDSLAAIEAEHGKLKSDCVAKTQGGGEHRLFLADASQSFPATLGPGLDLKHRGYICVEPTRGPQGVYQWLEGQSPLSGASPSPLPKVIREIASKREDEQKHEFRPGTVVVAPVVYADLRAALKVIPPDCPYPEWFAVLQGLTRLSDLHAAFNLALEWSTRSNKAGHTEDALKAKWRNCLKENYTVSYTRVFFLADQHDRGWRDQTPTGEHDTVTNDDEPDPENLFESIEPADFDADACLPPVVAKWVKANSQASGLDAVGYAFAALAVMAAATNRSVRVNLGSGHNVPIVIWSAIVGATGSGKSPAMNAAHGPLSAINGLEAQRTRDAYIQWKKLPKVERSSEPPEMRRVRYSADTTTEALTANLAKSDGPRIIVHYDEGSGWLNNMGRYTGSSDGDRGTYLTSWLGPRDHMINRVGRGVIHVPEFGACILFGITPNKIKEGQKEATDEGLLGRTLICTIKRRSHEQRASTSDDVILTQANLAYTELIAMLTGVADCEITFSTHAQAEFRVLRQQYGDESVALQSMYPGFAAMLAKAAENLGRLAGLFRLCREPDRAEGSVFSIKKNWTVESEDLALAFNLMKVATDHAACAYTGLLMVDEPTALAQECAKRILRAGLADPKLVNITRDQFMKVSMFSKATPHVRAAALDLLNTYHWLIENTTQRNRSGGYRFSDGTRWRVNPKVFDGRFQKLGMVFKTLPPLRSEQPRWSGQ